MKTDIGTHKPFQANDKHRAFPLCGSSCDHFMQPHLQIQAQKYHKDISCDCNVHPSYANFVLLTAHKTSARFVSHTSWYTHFLRMHCFINMLNNIHWFVISRYNTIKFALKYEEATGQINRQSSFPKTESIYCRTVQQTHHLASAPACWTWVLVFAQTYNHSTDNRGFNAGIS